MTFTYYIYNGTIKDFLNIGSPHPKGRTFKQAYQISFEKYLEQNPLKDNVITGKNPWDALELLKKYHRLNPRGLWYHKTVLLIISFNGKLICSYQYTNK